MWLETAKMAPELTDNLLGGGLLGDMLSRMAAAEEAMTRDSQVSSLLSLREVPCICCDCVLATCQGCHGKATCNAQKQQLSNHGSCQPVRAAFVA